MSPVSVIPIGSGSTGNAFHIGIGPYQILVDMGIGFRKVRDALEKNGRNIEDIDAIFLTHGHHDHVKAATAIANHVSCRVYANMTAMYAIRSIPLERVALQPWEESEVLPGLIVKMFPIPHDYAGTCAYVFRYEDRKIGFLTDCGRMDEKILQQLQGCDPVIIEANHDVEMLKNGPYPRDLQKRILSRYGHLSNEDCAMAIAWLYEKGSRNFLLAHISQNNNLPELALKAVRDRIDEEDLFLYACPAEGDDLLKL